MASKVKLQSFDLELFQVDEAVALQSQTLKYIIEDTGSKNAIFLPVISGKTLAKVIDYCQHHVEAQDDEETANWDAEFMKVNQETLLDLIHAANYLNIRGLLDLTCQTVADMIKRISPGEIPKTFKTSNDISISVS